MLNLDKLEHHPLSEQLVKILCEKVQNDNPLFFRVLVAYYFSVVASSMRCTIATHDRGDIPVNLYALNLGNSGSGKGHSTTIMETEVVHLFRQRFVEDSQAAQRQQGGRGAVFDAGDRLCTQVSLVANRWILPSAMISSGGVSPAASMAA